MVTGGTTQEEQTSSELRGEAGLHSANELPWQMVVKSIWAEVWKHIQGDSPAGGSMPPPESRTGESPCSLSILAIVLSVHHTRD